MNKSIRKNSIKATAWIYIGFFIGAANTIILTNKTWFSIDQNGLTRSMIEISQLVFAFSCLGTPTFLFKFFPYYEDNLSKKNNDILGIALMIALAGFIITSIGFISLEPYVVRKFSANSPLLVEYYFWILPMGFFVLLYNTLEMYSFGFGKGVVCSLLKETILRLYSLIIIVLKIAGLISFHSMMILFSLQYLLIVVILIIILKKEKQLFIHFSPSKVTKKYRKKILSALALTFIVVIVGVIRQSIDGLVLAAKQNLGKVGIFGFATYMVSMMQAPFRGLITITIPVLSRAWKEKNHSEIQRIYNRTSINMLGFSLFVFFCIWLNFENGIKLLNINPLYLEGKWVFFLIGIVTIIETGTGVNGQIIGASSFWRFELWTSLLLTLMIIPLSYTLTTKYGILGPAFANLISFTVYNIIRIIFLWKKFKMQPFSFKTVELLFIGLLSYSAAFSVTREMVGIQAIIVTLIIFIPMYVGLFYWRNISPDVKQIASTIKNRFSKKDS